MRYDHTTLDNGLRVIGEYNDEALSMAAGFFCRTGARDETPKESGTSHFLEHMMFKGTATLSYDHINKTFDRIGARYNAFTSDENTVYFGQVLPEYQEDLVDLLGQMMRPALRGEDFEMEKNVILEEIAMYLDQPMWVAHDHCCQLFNPDHAIGRPVLGTADSIRALARDEMADYFERRYAADNLVLAFSGKYDWEAGLRAAQRLCGAWRPSGVTRDLTPPATGRGLRAVRLDKFNQVNVYMMCPGLAAQDEDRFAASVLAAAIGSGEASRLHWALVDPGLAESAHWSHEELDGCGKYAGVLVCAPDKLPEAFARFRGELAKAQDEGLREDEVQRAIRRFGMVVLQAESPLRRLVNVGMDWVYRGRITPLDEFLAKVRAVTAADCARLLAARPFDALAAVGVGPVEAL
jgi:predicted Zn-dependent peptidase